MKPSLALSLCLLAGSGCATSFTGPAEIQGGRPGCEQKCASVGMEMQAFVFMGEYSTACVCDVPGRAQQARSSAATAAAAVSVMTQMRAAQDQYCEMGDCGRFGE